MLRIRLIVVGLIIALATGINSTFTVRTATVINNLYGITTFMTSDGKLWLTEGNYNIGSDCILTFDNNGTDSVRDDKIVNIGFGR